MDISLILVAIAGYFIGSISFARVVARAVNPAADLNQARMKKAETGEEGTVSGIGASTASVALGKKYGGIVASLDILKAFIPVLLLRLFFPDQVYHLVYSILCIFGHNYPIYYRFEGGRGLSPMLGSLLAVEPLGLIVCMLLGTLIAILINQPHTSLILWFPLLALWGWFVDNDLPVVAYAFILFATFMIAEIPEIRLAMQYRKQGRMDEYNKMILDSSPQTRAMQRLAAKIRFWEKSNPPR
ncbi:MAG: glycerol-3-phosphate acyltransferase [Anaerolineales bacterium]|nr:glycerol-3-phosphate acyltransferase [Anaerolineales bacterium]